MRLKNISPIRMLLQDQLYRVLEYFFLTYFFIYNSLYLYFICLAFFDVKRKVRAKSFEDLKFAMNSPFTPPISILVPAYNEDKTILESIRSLLNLQFPRFEIVIINDGSEDNTLDVLKKVFNMRRVGISYRDSIATSPIKGFYESRGDLPEHVTRIVLIDKVNGGKADAMNAGINASLCPYFLAVDADCIIDDKAALQAFRCMLDNRNVIAIGGQIGILNGCRIQGGKVAASKIPKSWLVRFQIVEYIRSFTLARTAFCRLNSLLIISGAFGIFRKDLVQKAGGYLTSRLTSKIISEYSGPRSGTVCEDIEIIVRLQRYIREKKLPYKIEYTPYPLVWTEVPEDLGSLSSQRNRWQRGLIETLSYHRKILFNRKYGAVGLFAFPFYFIFEFIGAPVEFLGYITLPILFALDNYNYTYLILFLSFSVLYGIIISTISIVISAWPYKTADIAFPRKSLFYFKDMKAVLILIVTSCLENIGYRQINLLCRVMAIIDYLHGKKGWGKFDRKGFGTGIQETEKDAAV